MPENLTKEKKVEKNRDLDLRLINQKLLNRLLDDCSTVGIGKRVIGGCGTEAK